MAAPQDKQVAELIEVAYVPEAQTVQVVVPPELAFPAAQAAQTPAPALL